MSLIRTKSVSFNIENDHQCELLDWTSKQRIGFSEYVKELIARDMKLRKASVSHVATHDAKNPPVERRT